VYERLLPRRFWRLVVCKEADRQFFSTFQHRVFIVPNGTTACPVTSFNDEKLGELLFVGSMSYAPNIEAVQFFTQSILPKIRETHPEACLHIVGRAPEVEVKALHDGITCIVHGEVPEVSPYYEKASVVTAPIRLGGGTRLKVLEALVRGKALVATSIAAEGLDLRPSVDLEIADTPDAFAAACVRLLEDPARRRQLGLSARQRVLERYEWQQIGKVAAHALEANLESV
jgi:glycosyltransferase involved in cell wall biosynthesis